MLRYLYIKTRHRFISNHSKCLGGVFITHLNFKAVLSEIFNLMKKLKNGGLMPMIVKVLFFTIIMTKFVLD